MASPPGGPPPTPPPWATPGTPAGPPWAPGGAPQPGAGWPAGSPGVGAWPPGPTFPSTGAVSPDGAWVWTGNGWTPNPAYTPAHPFRLPRISSALVTCLLLLAGAAAIFVSVAAIHRYQFIGSLADGTASGDVVSQARSADDLVRGSLIALGVTALITAPTFLTWMYIVVRNNATLGGKLLDFGPGGAVGWWFCPLLNYVQPFRALDETWKVSQPMLGPITPDRRRRTGVSPLLVGWWLALVAGNAVSLVVRVVANNDPSFDAFKTHDAWLGAFGGVAAVAAFLGAAVVRTLTQRQEYRAARLAASTLPPM